MNATLFITLYSFVFLIMICLWRFWPERGPFWAIFLIALVFRAALLPLPPNSDINRYIWEGKIQNYGYNPYVLAPDSPRLLRLRDPLWENINHKSVSAVYGPFAEILFRLCAAKTQSPFVFKTVFIAFDLGTMLVLALLMRTWLMERRHLFLYALNPLVLYEIAGEGHLESVMVFWLAGAFYLFRKQKHGPAFLLYGLACATKLTPFFLFPLLLKRKNAAWSFLTLLPIGFYGLYTAPGLSFLSVPLKYSTDSHFNGFAATIFSWVMPAANVPLFCGLLFASMVLCIFFLTPDPLKAAFYASGAFVLCSTSAQPWYLLLVTVLVPFYRSVPWIVLHLTMASGALVNIIYVETGVWKESPLLWAAEYLPFAAIGIWSLVRGAPFAPAMHKPPLFLSVIIPTLNECENIRDCIKAIAPCPQLPHEIIVADGGSNDGTCEELAFHPSVKVVPSAPGRGVQIMEGIKAAKGDAILILHADSRLEKTAIPLLASSLRNNPHAVGGAFRARYRSPRKRYALTSLLNNIRTVFTGISFGDQAQFFRKPAVEHRFPAYKIMEDIELSFLMKESGAVMFLPVSVVNSVRKWERDGYVRNSCTVLRLTLRFIAQRRLGFVSRDCQDFYARYYQERREKQWQASVRNVARS